MAGDELGELLEFLKRHRGFDFSGYKRTSLERRIRKRMDTVGIEGFGAYQDYLEVHQGEFTDLFNTILINVTAFFRDKPAWDFLAADVIPKLLEDIPAGQPIRIWCAACASGEEAYTTAIVFAEALGETEFRSRVKIYATDADEEALTQARQATYSSDAIKGVPDALRDRYFQNSAPGYTFRTDLRRSIIFGRNDLVQDAPISRVDLLVSRNALMYFIPEAQAQILRRFNFSLNDGGFLFLGKPEMLVTHGGLFTPYNLHWRVFRRVPQGDMRERYAFVTGEPEADGGAEEGHARLRRAAVDVAPTPQVVVDSEGIVAGINQAALSLLRLAPADLGRPLQDLEISYRPADVRTALEQAYDTRRAVNLGRVSWRSGSDDMRTLEVAVTPIPSGNSEFLGASITFADVTAHAELDRMHADAQRQLETAYEELQSTVEELETTNEELQSTNEELETTNEELQSSNEELETMNDELQATNDELERVNVEQGVRSTELDRLNLFLEGILRHIGQGVAVVDRDLVVQLWNSTATELWGLRADETVGHRLMDLDIGLPVHDLSVPIGNALSPESGEKSFELDSVNRRGRAFRCAVTTLPLVTPKGETYGAILLMSEAGGS